MKDAFMLFLMTAVCLGLTGTAIAAEPFYMGMYANQVESLTPSNLTNIGASISMFYHQGYLSDADVLTRLNAAQATGLKVIMDIDGITQDGNRDVTAVDTTRLTQYINSFKNHPAVVGWYLADEPTNNSTSRNNCELAYNTIKSVDTANPVYLAICHSDEGNDMIDFANAYDVLMFDKYVMEQGDGDCYRIPDHGMLWWEKIGMRTGINTVSSKAASVNKSWVLVNQAFGRLGSGYSTRMPTRYEHRWTTYYAMMKGAEGIVSWEYAAATNSPANSSDAYPYSGTQWLMDIYKPLAEEIAVISGALAEGEITGGISDNESDILSSVYQDPVTGKSYMLALNSSGNGHNPVFSVNLPGQADWVQATRMDKNYTLSLSGEQFSEYLSPWEVATYELIMDNVAPVAVNDSYGVAEDNVLQVVPSGVLINDTDVNPGDTLTAIRISETAHGSVTLNSDGSLSYTPNPDWHGTDTFTYKANDGMANSNEATVSITVDPVPDLALVDNGCPATGLHSYTLTATNPGIMTLSKFTIFGELHQVFASEQEHSEWLGDGSASESETSDSYVIFGDIRLPDLGGGTWPGPGDPPDKFTEETIDGGGTVGFGTLNNYEKENDFWDAYIKLGAPSFDEETVDLMRLVTPDGSGFTVVLTLVVATGYDQAGNLTMQRYELTLALPTLMPGDADGNGYVDAEDVAILAQNWLQDSDATWAMGDFNRDGKVNDIDAAILAANWNPQSASVPEPTLVISILSSLSILQLTRWKRLSRPLRPVPHGT